MPYFEYRQNNSGGSFDFEDWAYGVYVIIEEASAYDADRKAEDVGLYFDGDGDCSCCGDRWYEAAFGYDKGADVPSVYGQPIDPKTFEKPFLADPTRQHVVIHHLDGRVEAWTWDEAKGKHRVSFK